ncbi:unnamed protein product [Amoebophrya sp. A120]|nr:unnamed protein product [Amoebophrya sp. A120]|eukprot:GSA120T00022777001.1
MDVRKQRTTMQLQSRSSCSRRLRESQCYHYNETSGLLRVMRTYPTVFPAGLFYFFCVLHDPCAVVGSHLAGAWRRARPSLRDEDRIPGEQPDLSGPSASRSNTTSFWKSGTAGRDHVDKDPLLFFPQDIHCYRENDTPTCTNTTPGSSGTLDQIAGRRGRWTAAFRRRRPAKVVSTRIVLQATYSEHQHQRSMDRLRFICLHHLMEVVLQKCHFLHLHWRPQLLHTPQTSAAGAEFLPETIKY